MKGDCWTINLSNYLKGDAAQLDRRQVQDDLEPDCCHLDEEEAVAAALPGFHIFFKEQLSPHVFRMFLNILTQAPMFYNVF